MTALHVLILLHTNLILLHTNVRNLTTAVCVAVSVVCRVGHGARRVTGTGAGGHVAPTSNGTLTSASVIEPCRPMSK